MRLGDRISRKDDDIVYKVTGLNTATGAVYAELDTERHIQSLTIPPAKVEEWLAARAPKQKRKSIA